MNSFGTKNYNHVGGSPMSARTFRSSVYRVVQKISHSHYHELSLNRIKNRHYG